MHKFMSHLTDSQYKTAGHTVLCSMFRMKAWRCKTHWHTRIRSLCIGRQVRLVLQDDTEINEMDYCQIHYQPLIRWLLHFTCSIYLAGIASYEYIRWRITLCDLCDRIWEEGPIAMQMTYGMKLESVLKSIPNTNFWIVQIFGYLAQWWTF